MKNDTTNDRHHLMYLIAENIKRVKAISMPINRPVTVITGRNASGKSSVLDALMFLLMGKKHPDTKLLREGEKKGFVEVETEEYIIKRTLTEAGGGTLTIRSKGKNGEAFAGPQGLLDSLTRRHAFDPLEFMNAPPKDQARILRDLVGVDMSAFDERIRQQYDERTELNREYKSLVALIDAWDYDASATQELAESGVRAKLDALRNLRHEADEAKARSNQASYKLQQFRDLLGELRSEQARLEAKLAEIKERIANGEIAVLQREQEAERATEEAVAAVQKVPDPAELMQELDRIRAHNKNVANTLQRAEKLKERDELRRKSEALTRSLAQLEEEKKAALAAAQFPIQGLAFTEDGVTFNGLPLTQASHAEQIRVTIAIGAAMNPQLPVMVIKLGSFLDEDSMNLVHQLAVEQDLQVIVERVEQDKFATVLIEAGELRDLMPERAGETKTASTDELPGIG